MRVRSRSRIQRLGEDPTLLVPGLPPGVGKVDVDGRQARPAGHICHEEQGVAGKDADVGQGQLGHPVGGLVAYFLAISMPKKVVLGPAPGGVGQEEPLARADLEFDRAIVAEEVRTRRWEG